MVNYLTLIEEFKLRIALEARTGEVAMIGVYFKTLMEALVKLLVNPGKIAIQAQQAADPSLKLVQAADFLTQKINLDRYTLALHQLNQQK